MSVNLPWNARRSGEWLELMPGKLVVIDGDKMKATHDWLKNTLGIPPKLWNQLVAEGGIRLAGDRVRIHLFSEREWGFDPYPMELSVLYEDDFCMVVHKSPGLLVHPSVKTDQQTLANGVAAYYANQGENIAVRHVHRLDEYTSGPVLYAKNDFALHKLDEAMSSKKIDRRYLAFVQGVVDPKLQVVDEPIGKDRHHGGRRRVSQTGKQAVTRIELVESYKNASLVRLTLETGRTHQIRVHLSHVGHPLIGDHLYGGETTLRPYQALHGQSLHFPHPLTGEEIEVLDPLPESLIRLQSILKHA